MEFIFICKPTWASRRFTLYKQIYFFLFFFYAESLMHTEQWAMIWFNSSNASWYEWGSYFRSVTRITLATLPTAGFNGSYSSSSSLSFLDTLDTTVELGSTRFLEEDDEGILSRILCSCDDVEEVCKKDILFSINPYSALNFWKFTSYCSLKPLWSGMGEVVPARTSPTLHPPSPPTVHQLSWLAL